MSIVDRLKVVYEVQDAQFRAGMDRMGRDHDRAVRGILTSAGRMEQGVNRSFSSIAMKAGAAAAAVGTLGAAFAGLTKYSDSYKTVENRLRAIGEASDEAAEKLLGVAIRSRAPIEELSTSVMRLQKATGDGFDVTLQRAETLNKLLAVGGASASEVSSVFTQLTQALSSGVLQGDELRSLREAAPVELLDAIAEAAGATRAELKDLGAEGLLTTEIITEALDKLAGSTDAAFNQTTQTAGQALTNLNSALTVFAGRLDEGLGSSDRLVAAMTDLATWLQTNADTAEQFGQSIAAALETAGTYAGELRDWLVEIGALSEAAFKPDAAQSFGQEILQIIEFVAEMNGAIEGAAAVAREAFLRIADNIAEGMAAAINGVISAVESMINGVLSGVRAVASVVDSLTAAGAAANRALPDWLRPDGLRTEGTNLAAGIGNVSFDRVGLGARHSSGGDFAAIYEGARTAGRDGVLDGVKEATDRYNGIKTRNQIAANTPLSLDLGALDGSGTAGATGTTTTSGAGSSGGAGGSKGGAAGKLKEAKEATQEFSEALRDGKQAQAEFESGLDSISNSLAGVITQGDNLRESLANVFRGIANDLLSSGIRQALTSSFGGLLGFDPLSSALRAAGAPVSFGGFRANGGNVSSGKAYMTGEEGPELFVPGQNGTVLNASQISRAMGGANGQTGSQGMHVTVGFDDSGNLFVRNVARQEAASAAAESLRRVPAVMDDYNKRNG